MFEPARLTAREFQHTDGVGDWRVLGSGAYAWFAAPSHAAGAELVARALTAVGDAGPVLDADVRATGVQLRTATPGGLTDADVVLAREVSAAAVELGLVADPSVLQRVQLAVDTAAPEALVPFWRSALGYDQAGDDLLVDALRRDPALWFQDLDAPRPLRNRLHLDVGVPPETARDRVAAVEAAGGQVVRSSDFHAALADADGNEVDVVPLQPEGDLADAAARADWRVAFAAMVHYPTPDAATASALVAAVAALADAAGIDLSIDLRPAGVTIDSGKDRWEAAGFAALAADVQAAARGLGLRADAAPLRFVQLGIDAVDVPAVREFWRAVLGYELDAREFVTDIVDPRQLSLPLFFQPTEADDAARRAQRNRTHVDVFVPDDQAEARIAAALAAGGRVVYDADAPEWWTLADPEGNEVDIAVVVGREELEAARAHAHS